MSRHPWYRYGSWLVLHGSGAHLVGFSTACWLTRDGNHTLGLWTRCDDSRCTVLTSPDVPDWLMTTRVLACVGVVLIAMWLLVGCQCQCLKTRQQRHKWMLRLEELLAISSGCSALLSVGVFAVASASDVSFKNFSLSWSLWLVVGGALACALGGFVVAATRYPANPAPKPSTRIIGPSNTVGAGGESELQDVRGTGGERRIRSDVADIFNVTSVTGNSERDHNVPYLQTESSQFPPPYYVVCPGGTEAPRSHSSQTNSVDNSFHACELSLSPPPSYDTVINEAPPPYQQHVPLHVCSASENSSDWLL